MPAPIADCSLSITCSPGRGDYLKNLLFSVSKCNSQPKEIIVFFNEFSEDLIESLDYSVKLGASVFIYQKIQPLARLWNQGILNSCESNYKIIMSEDTEVIDPNFFSIVEESHTKNNFIVKYAEAACAFSVTKKTIMEIGWFDENYIWSWEDSDYRLRLKKFGIEALHVFPEPVAHLRALGSNGYKTHKEKWDHGMNFFYKKWDIKKCISENNLPFNIDENSDDSKRSLLFSGFFGDYFYSNFAQSVDQRIETTNYYNPEIIK